MNLPDQYQLDFAMLYDSGIIISSAIWPFHKFWKVTEINVNCLLGLGESVGLYWQLKEREPILAVHFLFDSLRCLEE